MRVLVTGAGGQLGHDLQTVLAGGPSGTPSREVAAFDHGSLDVADRDAVFAAVTSARPEVVIHAAAWTAVDACESDPERAEAVNTLGTANIADAAHSVDARVVYVSTDYVFDGTKGTPYVESDATNPQSVYGRTKLGGELALDLTVDTVARTSWVCGEHGNNMVKTILRLAGEHETLTFVDDQRGHPSFTDDLAAMMVALADSGLPGVFHVTNQGAVSWYEFAQAVLDAAGLDPARVQPIATSDLDPPRPAPRPANSVLENAALRDAGFELLPDFREPLARLVDALS